ncbi:hypothetical protein KCU87_g373, partial [Aureobasidium melanogenum]
MLIAKSQRLDTGAADSQKQIDTDRRPSTTVRGLLCLKSVVPWRSADHSVFSAAGVGWLRVAEQLSRDGKSIERAPSPAFLGLSQFSSRQKAEFVDSAQKITSWQGQVSARQAEQDLTIVSVARQNKYTHSPPSNFTHQPFLLFIAVKPQIPHALADLTRFVCDYHADFARPSTRHLPITWSLADSCGSPYERWIFPSAHFSPSHDSFSQSS